MSIARVGAVAALLVAGACPADPTEPSHVLEVRLVVDVPVLRAGDPLTGEVVVTNRGLADVRIFGQCRYDWGLIDSAGRRVGQGFPCTGPAIYDEHGRVEPGESEGFPRFLGTVGTLPGRYRAVASVFPERATRLWYSDTVVVTIEPALP
jgi:hypothetical protein